MAVALALTYEEASTRARPMRRPPAPRTANVNYQAGPAWAQTLTWTRPCLLVGMVRSVQLEMCSV